MSFTRWLRNLQSLCHPPSTPGGGRKARVRFRPRLEVLEDRLAPAVLTVTNNSDTGVSGDGSLRGEIAAAAPGDTIVFDPSLNGQTITLTGGQLEISKNVSIAGPGASQLTVSGDHVNRVFFVDTVTVSLSGLTIANGGSGITNFGNLTVTNCTLSDNSAAGIDNEGGALAVTSCTLSDNSATNGGGIFNIGFAGGPGTLAVTNCTLSGNSASVSGGGIYNDQGATVQVTNSVFSGNTASGTGNRFGGGGIFTFGSPLTVTNCTFSDNSATNGGGILNFGNLTVTNSTFDLHNSASNDGGGIANETGGTVAVANSTFSGNNNALNGAGIFNTGTAKVTDSTLSDNTANFDGGGIGNLGTMALTNCTLAANSATSHLGGGVSNSGPMTVTNCTFAGNSAHDGGGIANEDLSTLTLTNCTLADNSATGHGGGLLNLVAPTVANTIIAGNTAPNDPDAYGALTSQGYNLIGNSSGGSGFAATDLIGVNPQLGLLQDNGGPLAGAPGSQQVVPTLALLPSSPAIDTGSDALAVDPATGIPLFTDERGFDRVANGTVDIGAFEVQIYLVYSNADSGGGTLRTALSDADRAGGSVIAFTTGGTINLASALPDITRSVQILGPGADDLTVQRSTAAGTPDFGIFFVNGPSGGIQDITVAISGLTIANGNAIDGAGIETFATLTVSDCVLAGNTATSFGGGIYNQDKLTVTDSTFSGNSAPLGGGIADIFSTSRAVVTDSTFSGNSAQFGGGIYETSNLTVTNSTLAGNSATHGGGIYNIGTLAVTSSTLVHNSATYGGGMDMEGPGNSTWTVTNSTLSDNSATFGGGIDLTAGTGFVTGTTISNNSVGGNGGGLSVVLGSTLTLINCTVASNSALGGIGGGIATAGTLTLTNCTVAGNSAFADGGGISTYLGPTNVANTILAGNTSALGPDAFGPLTSKGYNLIGDPSGSSFVAAPTDLLGLNPLLAPLGNYGGATQTMALLPGSPAIDTGSNALVPAGLTTDQRGLPRIVNNTVDIGAFESRGFTLAVAGGNNQQALVNTPFPAPLSVTVSSPFGEPIQGGVVTFAVPPGGASAIFPGPNTATLDASGHAAVSVSANATTGTYPVTASASGARLVSFNLTNLPALTLSPTSLPDATAGVAYSQTLTASGGAGAPYTFAVTGGALPGGFNLSSSGALSGSSTVAGSSSFTVTVTDANGFTASQAYGLTIDAAAAASFAVNGFPTPTTAGVTSTFFVKALDAFGNTATGYSGTVTFKSSDPQAVLPAPATLTNGSGTFTATLKTAGSQSLTAADTTNASLTGNQTGIVVNPAATSKFVVAGFPSPVTAGVPGPFAVTAEDTYGNVTPAYSGTVHFSSSDPQAALPANATLSNGIGTFTATLKTAGTQSLTATDTANAAITGSESGITVNPGAATHFGIAGPSSVTASTAFSITVTALDACGNVATGYLGTVKFASTDSGAKLPGKYTFTASDQGVHTFTGLVLHKKGTQSITVNDASNNTILGTVAIAVL
jgi:hypothetical protein